MKRNENPINKLISEILKEYIILEAEGDEAGGGDEGNPFAAAADAGGEGGDAAAAAGGAGEEKKDEEGDKKPKEQQDALTFSFDVSGVKKYNTAHFRNSQAVAKKITKNGILATVQPDGVDILVGFDDITESVNQFFKQRK
jgi:hypothetical protein